VCKDHKGQYRPYLEVFNDFNDSCIKGKGKVVSMYAVKAYGGEWRYSSGDS
jgi:hypothetical protein